MSRLACVSALVAVVAVSGCNTRADLEAGRGYRCVAAGTTAECADDWVCGLDGFCHDPAIGERLPCSKPEHCTGGWVCALDSFCHDPDVGEPLPCSTSADCTGGWHCGAEASCYDRSAAGAVKCRAELDDTDGTDCAPGWRCSLDGVCVDSRAEALRPAIAPESLVDRVLSPVLSGDAAQYTTGAAAVELWPHEATSTLVRVDGGLIQLVSTALADGGLSTEVYERPLGEFIDATAFGSSVYTTRDGGVAGHGMPQFPSEYFVPVPFAPRSRVLAAEPGYTLFGWDDTSYWQVVGYNVSGGGWGASGQGPRNPTDVRIVNGTQEDGGVRTTQFIASPRGISMSLRDANGFRAGGGTSVFSPRLFAVRLPGIVSPDCGVDGGAVPLEIRAGDHYSSQHLVAVRLASDGGAPIATYSSYGTLFSSDTADCSSAGFGRWSSGACEACPAEYRMVDFEVIADGARFVTLCQRELPGGGAETRWFSLLSNCSHQPAETPGFPTDFPMSRVGHGRAPAYVTTDGRVVLCAPGEAPGRCSMLQLTTAPQSFAWLGDGGVVARTADANGGAGFFIATPAGFVANAPAPTPATVVGFVRQRPSWQVGIQNARLWIAPDGVVANAVAVAGSSGEVAAQVPPVPAFAELVTGSNDSQYLVLASGDSLWSAAFSEATDAGVVDLALRSVPLPRATITSFAVAQPGTAQAILNGYLIAQERLFRFRAETPVRWRTEEIPMGSRSPIDVWTDGDRGRVGFDDGAVASLPSRVWLADPLGSTVLDYEQVCGTAFALTADGLYLLRDQPGQWKGRWEAVPQQAASGRWRRLSSDGKRLLLVADDGTVATLEAPGCGG